MKSIFTDKQQVEIQQANQKIQELQGMLTDLLNQMANKEIETKSPKSDATLKSIIAYLQEELRKYMAISTEYQHIMDQYLAERDRICRDLNDEFMTNPETLAAIARLDEEFYSQNVARENGLTEKTPKFTSI